MDLAQLRAMRKTSSLEKIAKAIEKQNSTNSYDDARMWKLEGDKTGNGSAVIRFLPAINDEDNPWVKLYTHGFQGPTGKWYIENCLTTINKEDPVVEHCNALWNSGLDSDKDIARQRKRKLSFYSNVLVISDPKHPENEGKVFIFKYGKKVFEKIKDKMLPAFEDIKPCDIFNPFTGANFRLRMRKVEGYANFDQSEFDAPGPISDDEETILNVMNARHDLNELVNAKNFKSYDELKKKLDSVLSGTSVPRAENTSLDEDDAPAFVQKERVKAEPKARAKAEPVAQAVTPSDEGDVDDEMSYFRSIVDED
jgi:hypothetical protein